jgi:hypothetical protein
MQKLPNFSFKKIFVFVFFLYVLFLQEVPFENQIGFELSNSMVLIDKSSEIDIVLNFASRSNVFIFPFLVLF